MTYLDLENKIINDLENAMICSFATANKNGEVSARNMTIVNLGLKIYLQTDNSFDKIKDIKENPNVAINFGPYSFKGKAKIVGHPSINKTYIEKIKLKHEYTYKHYTNLANEVLIEIIPSSAKIWGIDFEKKIANQETITEVDFNNKTYNTIVCDKM